MNRISGRSVWRNDTWLEQVALVLSYVALVCGVASMIFGVDWHQGIVWKIYLVAGIFIPIAYFGPKIYRGLRQR